MSGVIGKNTSRSSGVIGSTTVSTDLVNDTSPQLGGFLDAAGNYIQMEKGGDIASGSPTVIDTDGDYFDVTGTTSFSAFTVAADRHFFIQFDGVLTMTQHATNLDLPGGVNITTAAGDVAEFVSTAANQVQCVNYTRASGAAVKIADESIDSDAYVDGSIDEAHIADNAVTLAKMAGGTDGQIITFDASGDPVAVGPGSDGEVLTSTGAGSPPAFEAAGGGGGGSWTLIGTAVASNSANLTITGLDSTYDTYAISWSDIQPVTDNQNLSLQVGDSSGLDSGAGNYTWHRQDLKASSASYSAGVSAGDVDAQISNAVGDQAGEGAGGMIFITRPGDGIMWPTWSGAFSHVHGSTYFSGGVTVGARNAVITLDRVAVLFGSGNIDHGRLTVWGIAHA